MPLPSRPRHPQENGVQERSGGYVKDNGLRGRRFDSLEAMAAYLQHWNRTVAQLRIHGTTRRQVIAHFLEVERPALQPLAAERFALFDIGTRTVHNDGHVEVASAYYSVPHQLVGRKVRVHWDQHLVRVYVDGAAVAVHVRLPPGSWSTRPEHRPAHKPARQEAYEATLFARLERIGPRTAAWASAAIEERDVRAYRLLQGVVALTRRHTREHVEWACGVALDQRCFRYRPLRRLVDEVAARTPFPTLLQRHEVIRDLTDYGRLATRKHHSTQGARTRAAVRAQEARHDPSATPDTLEATMQPDLDSRLRHLRLSGMAQSLPVRNQEAITNSLAYLDFLDLLVEDELNRRRDRLFTRRITQAGLPQLITLDDFNWAFNPDLPKALIIDLATARFVAARAGVLLIGPPGVGKSHICLSIALAAIHAGHTVLYRSAFDLAEDLSEAAALGTRKELIQKLTRVELLVIEDLGMRRLPATAAEDLLEAFTRRYEVGATMVSSNRPIKNWGQVLGDTAAAGAMLDRFLHRAEIVQLQGTSFRMHGRQRRRSAPNLADDPS